MKTNQRRLAACSIFFIFFTYTVSYAQQFSLLPSLGFGSTLAKNENANKKGRIMIGLSGYYNFDKQFSLGIEVATAGSFINNAGGNANQDEFDPATNTITRDASNMKSNTVLAKIKYSFTAEEKRFKPFAELGLGVTTHYEKVFNIPPTNEQKIKRGSFAIQPEIGVALNHFQLSIRYLTGGKTPAFTGVDNSGATVKYKSINISPAFFSMGWRFDL